MEGKPEGGGPRRYRRAEVEAAIEAEGRHRAEVEGGGRAGYRSRGRGKWRKAQDDTKGRRGV